MYIKYSVFPMIVFHYYWKYMIPGTAFIITGLYTAMILDVYQRVHSIDKAP